MFRIRLYCILILSVCWINLSSKSISPIDYGILRARNGEDRYSILYRVHVLAINNNWDIDYSGLNVINLEIPAQAKSIPLPLQTDFKGVVFNVVNKEKDTYLFSLTSTSMPISFNKKLLTTGNLRCVPRLRKGKTLLCIEDQNIWTERIGYSEKFKRKDILLVENGKTGSTSVSTYSNAHSIPRCEYVPVTDQTKYIKNVTLNRAKESTKKTFLLMVLNQYNVSIENLAINTPQSSLYADHAISIQNCVDVLVKDVKINGTYSQAKTYGYGIYLNNVRDISFINLKATGEWGVFGTYNVVNATLKDCDINRFDVHCYAKDILLEDCIIRDLYNQFSSLFGTLIFRRCIFDKAIPILLESSYNAFTPFNILMEDCTMIVTKQHNYIISAGKVGMTANARAELSRKALPGIKIDNLSIYVPSDVDRVFLFHTRDASGGTPISSIDSVDIDGLVFKFEKENPAFRYIFCNESLVFEQLESCRINSNLSDKNVLLNYKHLNRDGKQ